MQRDELNHYLDQYLEVPRFRDYCPNGLQVEGRAEIRTHRHRRHGVARTAPCGARTRRRRDTGAPRLFLERRRAARDRHAPRAPCAAARARPQSVRLSPAARCACRGRQQRAARARARPAGGGALLRTGNRHARRVRVAAAAGGIGCARARAARPRAAGDRRSPSSRCVASPGAPAAPRVISKMRCASASTPTSAARFPSRRCIWRAKSGVAFIAAGHHATERYGIQALGEHLAARFGLEHGFIDIENPV